MEKKVIIALLLFISFGVGFAQNRIVVSKKNFSLYVINSKNDTIFTAPVSIGKNLGNKTTIGDCKRPEGTFPIYKIPDAREWKHDFKDGYGVRKGAYGPYFLRLKMKDYKDIGIHGTCFPESVGTRSSEGCVRLRNEDITRLIRYIRIGTQVTILPEGE